MSLIIGADTTISTETSAEEVKVVKGANLTVTSILRCQRLIIEEGKTTVAGSGQIIVSLPPPPPSPFEIMLNILLLIILIIIIIALLDYAFKKLLKPV